MGDDKHRKIGALAGARAAAGARTTDARVLGAGEVGELASLVDGAELRAPRLARVSAAAKLKPSIDIDLPDLDDGGADIVADNIRALSAIYFAAQLEELKFFAVADKIAEQFMTGTLPLGRGRGGDLLYHWIRDAPNRLTEAERRGAYASTLGLGTSAGAAANEAFADLWLRFLAAVSRHQGGSGDDRKLVALAARALAINLSAHGHGTAHFFAVELAALIKQAVEVLSDPELCAAYGVRDRWQLVERVSATALGGARNSVRQRTMAQAGAKIIAWLSDHVKALAGDALPSAEIAGDVERWLAVAGPPDSPEALAP